MRSSIKLIYNTLYKTINDNFGSTLREFSRGFWYRNDCLKSTEEFPYAFLDQPEASATELSTSPSGYQYIVEIPLIILTMYDGESRQGLFFDDNDGNKGSVELVDDITNLMTDNYLHGLPFPSDKDPSWNVSRWILGELEPPTHRELNNSHILKNPRISASKTSFIFYVSEQAPLRR